MAAVISPQPTPPSPVPSVRPSHRSAGGTGRPHLTVIQGGLRADRVTMARVYRRRRLAAALLAAVLLVALALAADAGLDRLRSAGASSSAPIEGPTVVVEARSGDTVWSIARRVRPDGDVRPVVQAIIAERGGAELQVGDEVRVPIG